MEYNGRRLAKLNLPPSAILEALQEYDRLLSPMLESLIPEEHANFQWVREQLHFCVILTLNNAYYQVREAETQAFYELFRIELESRNLEELLRRFLESLVQVCQRRRRALYMLNEDGTAWVLQAGAPQARSRVPSPNQPGSDAQALQSRAILDRRTPLGVIPARSNVAAAVMRPAGRFRWPPTGAPPASCNSDFRSRTNGCRGSRNCWRPPPSAA